MKLNIEAIKKEKTLNELLQFGILNIDKPSGMTSFDVSDFVRKNLKEFGVKKTSHFGVLDPMVTGVLPVALGRAVRLTGFFIGEDKEYEGEMLIHDDFSVEQVKNMIKEKFLGKIMQKPPVRSNVKRQEREREIKKFEILSKEGKRLSFRVECQGGTYIRKLVHDLGEALGKGAHMTKLRRTRAGIFREKDAVSLENFEKSVKEYQNGDEKLLKSMINPAEIVAELYPIIEIKEENLKKIFTGSPIYKKDLKKEKNPELKKEQIVCIFSKNRFIEIGKVVNEGEIAVVPKFVLN